MKSKENLVKAWAKMGLNSCYGLPPIKPIVFCENKALQITEEGKNKLILIQETLKNITIY